jgi:hypothetical protein
VAKKKLDGVITFTVVAGIIFITVTPVAPGIGVVCGTGGTIHTLISNTRVCYH